MKITTWNVNGLRAALSKDALNWAWMQAPDVLCLQEIKARPDQIDDDDLQNFAAYQRYWHPAERAGYSGVSTWSLQDPERVQIGFGEARFDIEGRVIMTRHSGFLLFNVYVPNGQRDHSRLAYKLEFYAYLLDLCDQLHAQGEKIVICGDFNTAHQEIDLRNPKQNQNTSGFLAEERAWIDRYLEHGLVDIYRELYPEQVQYTWWTYRFGARQRNIGWRLDYYLITEDLVDRVTDVIIHEEIMGSDHCPVSLSLE